MIKKHWFNIVSVFALIYFGIAIYGVYESCDRDNGTLVRGLFWLECVNKEKS